MAPSLHFEDDAFISYGHIDNERLEDEERGWVDNLHARLEVKLGELLGYRPQVWRDKRLPHNAYFAGELKNRGRDAERKEIGPRQTTRAARA